MFGLKCYDILKRVTLALSKRAKPLSKVTDILKGVSDNHMTPKSGIDGLFCISTGTFVESLKD